MADIFGAVAAGITICAQLAEFGKAIRKATKRIKNSRRDIADLSDETVIFAGLCEEFLRTFTDTKSKAASSVAPLITWLRRTNTELSELLQKVEALTPDPTYRVSIQETLIAYLEWYFSKNAVKKLRASLTIARESMNGFSNVLCIQKLNEELQILKNALRDASSRKTMEEKLGVKLERKIKMVEQAIEIRGSVHVTNTRTIRTAKKKATKEDQKRRGTNETVTDDLFDFTELLQEYTEEVLPSVRPNRHSFPSHVSTSTSRSNFEQGRPEGWQLGHSYSGLSSYHKRRPRDTAKSSRVASSNVSISTGSGSSNKHYVTMSDSLSNMTSTTDQPVEYRPSRNKLQSSRPNAGIPEYPDRKSREYMNDPDGDILSCPKIKPHTNSTHLPRMKQIGRHTIALNATHFRIDNHLLRADRYEVADAFFRTLLQHEDKLDALVEELADDDREGWTGIPGWMVHEGSVMMQASTLGVYET